MSLHGHKSEALTNKINTLTPACVHSSTASLTPGRQGSCIKEFDKYKGIHYKEICGEMVPNRNSS